MPTASREEEPHTEHSVLFWSNWTIWEWEFHFGDQNPHRVRSPQHFSLVKSLTFTWLMSETFPFLSVDSTFSIQWPSPPHTQKTSQLYTNTPGRKWWLYLVILNLALHTGVYSGPCRQWVLWEVSTQWCPLNFNQVSLQSSDFFDFCSFFQFFVSPFSQGDRN